MINKYTVAAVILAFSGTGSAGPLKVDKYGNISIEGSDYQSPFFWGDGFEELIRGSNPDAVINVLVLLQARPDHLFADHSEQPQSFAYTIETRLDENAKATHFNAETGEEIPNEVFEQLYQESLKPQPSFEEKEATAILNLKDKFFEASGLYQETRVETADAIKKALAGEFPYFEIPLTIKQVLELEQHRGLVNRVEKI